MILIAFAIFSCAVLGQSNGEINRNNPFAPSPRINQKSKKIEKQSSRVSINDFLIPSPTVPDSTMPEAVYIRKDKFESASSVPGSNIDPTRVYRVGIGDVLAITIRNAAGSAVYYTVRNDGTIDFPLAGENVVVAGQTIEQIEASITDLVKLFQVPRVSVAIREYVSHGVLVKGLVGVPGYHHVHRDAVPLYVIRAAAAVNPLASGVTINRGSHGIVESYLFANSVGDNILIFPGDTVEFTGINDNSNGRYYTIGGNITNSGKREFSDGMTLSKAIATNGGVKGTTKRVNIRRRDKNGSATTTEYEINSLISGKIQDPTILPGDIIEVLK